MHTRPIALSLSAATLLALGLTGCSSANDTSASGSCTPAHDSVTTVTPGTLTVGVTDTPPFSQNNAGTDPTGVEIDYLKALAAKECLDITYVTTTFAAAIPAISQQKSIDIATGGYYPMSARNEIVDFVGPLNYDNMSIASRGAYSTVTQLESLDSVGTVDGYLWGEDLKKILGDKLKTYASSVELSQDLLNGRLDAAIDSTPISEGYYKDESDITVNVAEPDDRVSVTVDAPQTVFPVSKDATDLRNAFNEDFAALSEDGSVKQMLLDNGFDESAMIPEEDRTIRILQSN